MRLLESAVGELEQQAGFADAGLADDDVLEDVSEADYRDIILRCRSSRILTQHFLIIIIIY